jgi:hypothetical protein
MTKDVFGVEFKRLCDGFDYKPRATQTAAYYERLQHCHEQDWHEAVTDLLCAPYFPKSIDLMLEAVEKRAEQRRKGSAQQRNYQAQRTLHALGDGTGMWDALAEKPELLEKMQKFMGKVKP